MKAQNRVRRWHWQRELSDMRVSGVLQPAPTGLGEPIYMYLFPSYATKEGLPPPRAGS